MPTGKILDPDPPGSGQQGNSKYGILKITSPPNPVQMPGSGGGTEQPGNYGANNGDIVVYLNSLDLPFQKDQTVQCSLLYFGRGAGAGANPQKKALAVDVRPD